MAIDTSMPATTRDVVEARGRHPLFLAARPQVFKLGPCGDKLVPPIIATERYQLLRPARGTVIRE